MLIRQLYAGGWLAQGLRPIGALYGLVMRMRRLYYTHCNKKRASSIASLVVGNLTVGGSGKTPLVLAITQHLGQRGWHPAIISRGYRAQAPHFPYAVQPQDSPDQAGDEPLFMALSSRVPVIIGPDRHADMALAAARQCDIAVLDDGYQHLALQPDLSFVVMDGERGFGNAYCLPAGPLSEPVSALVAVDAIIIHGAAVDVSPTTAPITRNDTGNHVHGKISFNMLLRPTALAPLNERDSPQDLAWLGGTRVHAVAGIGYPQRFFKQLEALGAQVIPHPFPDHHVVSPQDFAHLHDTPIVMTAKDAVKCRHFALENAWVLHVEAQLDEAFWPWLDQQLQRIKEAREH